MTQDELFTAIYLVCGALPSEPEKLKSPQHVASMYRRRLGNGRYQQWLVDDREGFTTAYDVRIAHDPEYVDYYAKACRVATISLAEFTQYIAWAEAHEQRG